MNRLTHTCLTIRGNILVAVSKFSSLHNIFPLRWFFLGPNLVFCFFPFFKQIYGSWSVLFLSHSGMTQHSQMMMTSLSLHWQTLTVENWNKKRKDPWRPKPVNGIDFFSCFNHTISVIYRILLFPVPSFLIRTQFKKFLGKSVKKAKHLAEEYGEKAVNKVKSVRDEGKRTLHSINCCTTLLFLYRIQSR